MKDFNFEKIFDSMKKNEISEVVIKEGRQIVEIRRGGFKYNAPAAVSNGVQAAPVAQSAPMAAAPVVHHSAPAQHSTTEPAKPADVQSKNYYEQKSPLVGTFYSSAKPGSPAFVMVGDKVTKGQTLCIVEAMKNFNEIESDVDGVIKEILMKDGELVEFGKVIFKIEQA